MSRLGGQRGADVALVVVVDEGERGGRVDTGLLQRLVGGLGRLEDAHRLHPGVGVAVTVPGAVAAVAAHRRRHPAEQGGRPPAPGQRQFRPSRIGPRRQDEGDPFPVDVAQFHGEPLGERVVAADDHVAGERGALGLLWKWGHMTQHACSLLGVASPIAAVSGPRGARTAAGRGAGGGPPPG